MANNFSISQVFARKGLEQLINNLVALRFVNRDFEDEYQRARNAVYTIGRTINIKKPPRPNTRVGSQAQPQSTFFGQTSITLAQAGADLYQTSIDQTLNLTKEDHAEMVVKPYMESIANSIDRQILQFMRFNTANVVGTPGTPPTTNALAVSAFTNIRTKLNKFSSPMDNRGFIVSPDLEGNILLGLSTLFNNSNSINKQYDKGQLGDAFGFNVAMDQNVPYHTNGTQSVTGVTTNGANQTGTLITVNATTGTITRGTRVTFSTVNSVNPINKDTTGDLLYQIVTDDVPAGSTQIPIFPGIFPTASGSTYKNATNSIPNGAVMTIFGTASGTYSTSIAVHKDAYGYVDIPMIKPAGAIDVGFERYKGIGLRVIQSYDSIQDASFWRFDVLYGIGALYPELSVVYAN